MLELSNSLVLLSPDCTSVFWVSSIVFGLGFKVEKKTLAISENRQIDF
jgi:hypothetical protein